MRARSLRMAKGVFSGLTVLLISLALTPPEASAARTEKSIGLGTTFYSGTETDAVTPPTALQLSFSGNMIFKHGFNLVNHFDLGYLYGGENFGGSRGTYSGYSATYQLGLRFNFARDAVQPYLEAGPLIGFYAITLSQAPAGTSKNETSLKYGYTVGTGFDWTKGANRGDGPGWGVGFNYFYYFTSPEMFEFPSAALAAKGIRAEIRYLIGAGKK